jgi:phosphatidate cytidylyltransferase
VSNFQDLKKRFSISFLAILLVSLLIFFSKFFIVRFLVAILVMLISIIATEEFITFINKKNILLPKKLLSIFSALIILSFLVNSFFQGFYSLPILIFIIFFIFLFFKESKKIENSTQRIALSIFSLLIISVPLGMILPILFMNNFEMQDGRYWFLYIILVTKITDVAAYFFGRLFGKKKLSKKISPNKTVVGSVFGVIIAVLTSFLFTFLNKEGVFEITYIESIYLGLILSILSQFGDLFESLLKRDALVKDSNKLPGIGGIFDMIDSLIFNIPIMYLFLIG